MNGLIAFFARQRIFGNLLSVAVVVVGVFALSQIRRETFPNVKFDLITVSTLFPGASPEEVERLVTNVIEQELQQIDGIKNLYSDSSEGLSVISVQLDPDETTAEKGKSDVQDVVDRLQDLPVAAEKPLVVSVETKYQPIIELYLSGLPELELRAAARDLERTIERLRDVARVSYRGWRKLEFQVEPKLSRLSQEHLSLEQLISALARQNVSIPGGTIAESADRERLVRTIGDFSTAPEIAQTVVRANDLARGTRVGDLARVSLGLERAQVLNRVNGEPAIRMIVLQKERADAIRLVEEMRKRIQEVRPTLPAGFKITEANDSSSYIQRRLEVLQGNLVLGLVLVLVILSLILPLRVAILVSLGIPFAFLGTMAIFYVNDISLNLVSLIGLIIVSGMLVDDAIVVTDNAVRLIDEGMDPEEAAIKGTQQVWVSVVASVLTTVVAFIPLMTMSGIFGKFVKPISYGVILALMISLFEAFFILPGHIAEYIRRQRSSLERTGQAATGFRKFLEWTRGLWEQRFAPAYARVLEWSLSHRYRVALGVVGLFAGSVALAAFGMRVVLFPPNGVEVFMIQVQMPTGTSLQATLRAMEPLEKRVAALPKTELDLYSTLAGESSFDGQDIGFRRGDHYGLITVYLTPSTARERSADEIMAALRAEIGKPEGMERVAFDRISGGPPVGRPVSISVLGQTLEGMRPAVEELKRRLATYPGVKDIQDSYTLGKREARIRVDAVEAAAAGLDVAAVGQAVRAAFEGIVATSIRQLDEEIDVRVRLSSDERARLATLSALKIPNAQGALIPLSQVARIEEGQGIAVYDHKNNRRRITVTADVDLAVSSSTQANDRARADFAELKRKYPQVDLEFGGEDEDTAEALGSLGVAFVVAFIAIFLILVATFQQLFQPLLVLVTIPLGITAAIVAFFVHGWPITFLGLMGVIALGGVIVNNAIVMLDFVNQARKSGQDRFASIRSAASMRVRPIFLTTVTTVVGVLPTAYGIGGLDEFVVPLALALGWGLFFGAFLTALVFPAAIAILDDATEWWAKRRA